jgi:hypothetical protein
VSLDGNPGGVEFRTEYPVNVVLTRCAFNCSKCGEWKPASKFGLRDADGVVRNQPQCNDCRRGRPRLTLVK